MSDTSRKGSANKSGRVLDFFVVLLCLSGVTVSLYLFQRDLFRTFRSMTIQPAGTVTVKYNTVQRRLADRVVWDRLFTESPVYPGDLIRIAKLSGAMLNIDDNRIDLGENSLIRIQKDEGSLQIDFYMGNIGIVSEKNGGNIVLTIAGIQIEAGGGTSLNASVGDEGLMLRVSEGAARIIQDGQIQTVQAGTAVIQDREGRERLDQMVLVSQPKPNARYLKTGSRPININFVWNRINPQSGIPLRLEIATDRNFTRIVHSMDTFDSTAAVSLDAGFWYWRFLSGDTVLSSGRITVAETSETTLLYPEMDSRLYFRTVKPQVNFRWTEVDDALYYILQVSKLPGFSNPQIFEQVQGTSFISNELDYGSWFWRVQPVYPPFYEGGIGFSNAVVFYIDQGTQMEPPVLNYPVPGSMLYIGEDRKDLSFSWAGSKEAVSYNIKISADPNLFNPVIDKTLRDNFYVYRKDENVLSPGQYYWSVSYMDGEGNLSPLPQSMPFLALEREVNQSLVFPPDRYSIEDGRLHDTRFTWRTNLSFDRRFQVSAFPDFSTLEIDEPVTGDSFQGVSVPHGDWYWRISARYDEQSSIYSTPARRFSFFPPPLAVEQEPEPESPQPAARPAVPSITLASPAPGVVIPGLTALRQPTVFRWDTAESVGRSRFVLSRNSNPAARPEIEINNPGRTVTVNSLREGLWYWTIEAQTRDGLSITAGTPRQLIVQPVPLLPAPVNMRPARGHLIDAEELRQRREIIFSWQAVAGANAYIFTISRETPSGRQRILQTEPVRQLSYIFNNLELLEHNANYIWQIEALFINSAGVIEQRGRQGESSLILNIPLPGRVRTGDTGVLYGF